MPKVSSAQWRLMPPNVNHSSPGMPPLVPIKADIVNTSTLRTRSLMRENRELRQNRQNQMWNNGNSASHNNKGNYNRGYNRNNNNNGNNQNNRTNNGPLNLEIELPNKGNQQTGCKRRGGRYRNRNFGGVER